LRLIRQEPRRLQANIVAPTAMQGILKGQVTDAVPALVGFQIDGQWFWLGLLALWILRLWILRLWILRLWILRLEIRAVGNLGLGSLRQLLGILSGRSLATQQGCANCESET
tara:strand:- start:48624 stop:48959 length:336 start_codon:yes stop_codon:yes gene_type:complete